MDSYTIQVLKYIDTFSYVQTQNAPTFTYRDLSKVSPKYIHIYTDINTSLWDAPVAVHEETGSGHLTQTQVQKLMRSYQTGTVRDSSL